MSAVTVAASNLQATVNTFASQLSTLVTACQASEIAYRATRPGKEQAGLSDLPAKVRAALASTPQVAEFLQLGPQNPAAAALDVQLAAF